MKIRVGAVNEFGTMTDVSWFTLVSRNDIDGMKHMMMSGYDINTKDSMGKTALMFAAEAGHREAVNILLNSPNIRVDIQDKEGHTAKDLAHENVKEIFKARNI